eukprot:5564244-Pyramimonas_sp.AAC.2
MGPPAGQRSMGRALSVLVELLRIWPPLHDRSHVAAKHLVCGPGRKTENLRNGNGWLVSLPRGLVRNWHRGLGPQRPRDGRGGGFGEGMAGGGEEEELE